MKQDGAKYLLALNTHEKIGSQTLRKILAVIPDPAKVWRGDISGALGKLPTKIANYVLEVKNRVDPDNIVADLIRRDIGYLTVFDEGYPKILKEIYDSPLVLYLRGDAGALAGSALAVVGSRKPTTYGSRVTRTFVKESVESGLVIVSGLALGIDGEAHRATLEFGGKTVGVLACGLDQIYPANHLGLAKEMMKRGGAVISEFPPGTPALKFNFPSRNRIIAGLSLGTLVVEAAKDSGSLITAQCALEYNREVFAIPGPIDSPTSAGTNQLIQQGAKLVSSFDDIAAELPVALKKSSERAADNFPKTPIEQTIIDLLVTGEGSVDYLVAESLLGIVAVNSALTTLEMKGMIENIGGGRYRKIC